METITAGVGTPKPNGGRPVTIEDKQRIFARRERAVELRGMGLSYEKIAAELQVSWPTVRDDVERHLKYCALYYNASKFREQINAIHRATIRERYAIMDDLKDSKDLDSLAIKLKTLDGIDRVGAQMAKLYNLVDGDTNVILGDVHVTSGEGLLGNSPEWAKDMDPERLKELRSKVIAFYKEAHPNAVPAEFTVEVEEEERKEPEPALGEEKKMEPPTGPVTMSGS